MSTAPADWYPDPTQGGRLRYWDGSAWTEHVSRDGGVTPDPISGSPPPPPVVTPPAPAASPFVAPGASARTGERYPATILGRAGLIVAAVGGVLAAVTSGSEVVDQEGFVSISVTQGAWLGIVGTVVCLAAALAPWVWARLTGLGVAMLFGVIFAFAVIGFRTSEDLVGGIDVSLSRGGVLLMSASLLFFAGTAIGLVGFRKAVRGPEPGVQAAEGKGVASLVLGIVGLLIPPLAPPAVGLALMGMDDVRASGGRIGGRGIAIAGLVLGIVSFVLWGVGLLLGMAFAQP